MREAKQHGICGPVTSGGTVIRRFVAPLCCALTLVAPLASESAATGSADSYKLEEIIVTALRRAESAYLLPYAVNVQGMTELQEIRQVRTIPDAMRELPGVMVQKTGHGQGSPYIRGFTGQRTLFLVDGIRLNNSIFREGPNQYWNTVDLLSVDRLEMVKGPASVLYGSDAIGGTVNAISAGHGGNSENTGLRMRTVLRGASAERSVVLRPELGYSTGRFAIHTGVSLKKFGDLRAGGDTGEQPKTGYDEQDADLRVHFQLDDKRSVFAAIQNVNQDDAWRVHKTIRGKSWRGTTTGNEIRRSLDQHRTLAYVQYHADDEASRIRNLTLSASYHRQREERLRIRSDGRTDVQGTDVGTSGLWGQFDVPSRSGLWTTGAEVYYDDVDSFRNNFAADGSLRSTAIQGPVADDASYTTAAAFVQNQIALGENAVLIAGLRYTWSSVDADAVQDPQTGGQFSINDEWRKTTASLRYSQAIGESPGTRVFAGISQGFRAPNLSDLTRFDSARSNEFEIPVSRLGHEKFVSYELGTKLVNGGWNGQVSVFYTSINGLIVRTPTGRTVDGETEITKRNSGSGFVKGVELQASYRLSDAWYIFGNLAWIDGEVDTFPTEDAAMVREPLDRLMPLKLNLGARWQASNANYWLEAMLSAADNQDTLSSRDRADTDRIPPGGTPGYAVLTLRGGWTISDRLKLSLSVENVFDEDYRIHGSGLNEAGRNVVATLFWNN